MPANRTIVPIGTRFGKLVTMAIEEPIPNCPYARRIKCQCDCGNITHVRKKDLIHHTRSCGCLVVRHPPGIAARNHLIAQYRVKARKRGLEWALSKDEATLLFQSNCFYCNGAPSNRYRPLELNGGYVYNGLDRLENSAGYTLANTVPCCHPCNFAKSDGSVAAFLDRVNRIFNNLSLATAPM